MQSQGCLALDDVRRAHAICHQHLLCQWGPVHSTSWTSLTRKPLSSSLEWSKHHINSRTEEAAEIEAQSLLDNGLSERTLLQDCVWGSWLSTWLKETTEDTELDPTSPLSLYPPPDTPIQQLFQLNQTATIFAKPFPAGNLRKPITSGLVQQERRFFLNHLP